MKRIMLALIFVMVQSCNIGKRQSADGHEFCSFFGFELNAVKLKDVEQTLGKAQLVETGDAGAYQARISYLIGNTVINFLSSEIGGDDHELLGFELEKNTKGTAKQATPLIKEKHALEINGLKLGMTKAEFEAVVGRPNERGDGTGEPFHAFSSKERMTKEQIAHFKLADSTDAYFDVSVSVIGIFEKDRLKRLEVWRVITF